MMRRAVICFTRLPLPGRTKTRLLPLLTGAQCARLHTAFLRDLAAVYAAVDADLFIAYSPEGEPDMLGEIFPRAAGFFPQQGWDLGERMHRALCRVLALGYRACLLTGSYLPLLTPGHLERAFQALEGADAVLGPTPDGGYYLVGLRRPSPALFTGQRYGHGTVYENTLSAARAAALRVAAAPVCSDVDTPEDLAALCARLAGAQGHTARLLAGWKERLSP